MFNKNSKKKGRRKRVLCNLTKSVLTIATATLFTIGTVKLSHNVQRKRIEEYTTNNLEQIMQNLEDVQGIKFIDKPKIEFELSQDAKDHLVTNMTPVALYWPPVDTIYLKTNHLVTPKISFNDMLINLIHFGGVNNTYSVLAHELGHYHTDKIYEKIPYSNWWGVNNVKSDTIGYMLVTEGIAEHFERSLTCEGDNFSDNEWPEDYTLILDEGRLLYDGGFHLVNPIMEKYGEAGMIHLMYHLPTEDDLLNLPSYQKKIMKDLEDKYGKDDATIIVTF
jgi:hypothetical protein